MKKQELSLKQQYQRLTMAKAQATRNGQPTPKLDKKIEKMKEMIAAQGGDAGVCDDVTRLPQAKYLVPVPAPHDGYVADMDTTAIGYCAQDLGAGRKQKTDAIDPAVGLVMDVRIGDFVKQGDALATLHLNRMELAEGAIARMQQAVRLTSEKPATPPLVYAAVSPEGVAR